HYYRPSQIHWQIPDHLSLPSPENLMQSQIRLVQLFPILEALLPKVFRTQAASAFLSISPQIGNLNSAVRSHSFREADRRSPPLDRQNRGHRPRLQGRRRASLCKSWKSSEIRLTIFAEGVLTEGNQGNEGFLSRFQFCFLRCLLLSHDRNHLCSASGELGILAPAWK